MRKEQINARVSSIDEDGYVDIRFDTFVAVPGQMERQEMTFRFGARFEADRVRELRVGDVVVVELTIRD